MAIAFDNIPSSGLRVPLFYAELNSGGTTSDSVERLLVIGQKLATGSANLDEPILITSTGRIEDTYFGEGSMLSAQVKAAKLNAPFQEIWALPVTDGAGGVAATGTLDYTALTLPLTSTQLITAYVGGVEYNVVATAASTAATIATAMAAEINEDVDAPVTAADAAGVVTLTARHVGTLGNTIGLTVNQIGDESTPTGETVVTAMAGGLVDPDITLGLAALGDEDMMWIASPYSDATNMAAMGAFLDDATGRWGPLSQLYGHAVTASYDTVGNLSAQAALYNDKHISMIGVNGMPTPIWKLVAAAGAKVAQHLSSAPEISRPLQFLTLEGIVAPRIVDRFNTVDRNTLLFDGVATIRYDRTGAVQLERMITLYRTNDAGAQDSTFLDIQTLAQSAFVIKSLRNRVLTLHGRQALAANGAVPSSSLVTPNDIRNTLISAYASLVDDGVVEDVATFQTNLVVERNATDTSRVDVYLPFDAVGQLRVLAISANAFLQF
jgi:phage tail sheath gpL-like